ncbi:MAG: chemotaxis response regulator protein-glutamate methylesterase [Leptospiraceae bacterium]|nr:chemotaxis response regulator protein-glutamate methylesterase [Leptospiraceae bacterium]
MAQKVNVLVVDDSALIRKLVAEILLKESFIGSVETASDPIFARQKMEKQWPDVLVLDVEMPRMDGITFLRQLMHEKPIPVIIFSALTEKGAETSFQALTAGAFDVLTKPKIDIKETVGKMGAELIDAVQAAGAVDHHSLKAHHEASLLSRQNPQTVVSPIKLSRTTEKVVAIGTSAGGTQALLEVLSRLTPDCPGIAVVQHMPEQFTASFAERLNSMCSIEVREAKNMDRMERGLALIARGNKHMRLKMSGAMYHVEVVDGPHVSRHRPSVNVLFRSFAKQAGSNSLGIIMTGMGDDGAAGLLEMKESGAKTIAQDKDSCIVFGMPREAINRGAADTILPLLDIPNQIMRFGQI